MELGFHVEDKTGNFQTIFLSVGARAGGLYPPGYGGGSGRAARLRGERGARLVPVPCSLLVAFALPFSMVAMRSHP